MKSYAIVLISIGAMAVPTFAMAQQPATPISILAGALAGMGGTNIQAVTLTGSAESTAGSSDDTGSFTGNCSTGGSSQLSLQLSSGSFTENRQTTNGIPSGNWVDSSGVQHPMAQHNLLSPASWFCPVVALSQIVSATKLNYQFIGNELKNGATLAHFTINNVATGTSLPAQLVTHISQVDIYLNPQTSMPAVFDFTVHPDINAGTDIPVEIAFSNYTQVNGVWIPFTVERYVNSTLTLELKIQTVSVTPTASNAKESR